MLTKEQIIKALKSNNPSLIKQVHRYFKIANSPFYKFKPRPDNPQELDEQESFVNDNFDGIACLLGGTGGGKSVGGAYKVAKFLRSCPPPRKNTPYWVVSQTKEMASANNWGKNLSQFITDDMIEDIVWYSQARHLPKSVILKPHKNNNNWCIEFQSYDMDRRALQGFSLGGFWADELCPYSILIELWARCRDYNYPGSIIYTLTPLQDGSKGYSTVELEDIYKDRANHPDWKFYRLNSRLNDKLADGFIDKFISNEIEDLRETRLNGSFCSLSGAIYKQFNDGHIIEPFAIPNDWYHIRGIDFGWSHMTAVLWAARDSVGKYYIYHEYCQQKTLLRDHAEAIKSVEWGADRTFYGELWADPSAAAERHELADRGLQTTAAKNDVLPGIAAVQKLLRDKELFIFSNCKQLIKEMRNYCWNKNIKDAVAKQDDDACFIAGTLVETARGSVPIEEITTNDKVLTRNGYSKVLAAGETGIKLVRDYKLFTCTPNHPIWTKENNFIPIEEVCRNIKTILHVDMGEIQITLKNGKGRKKKVYNLQTEAGEYFANGVLVHNCDVLRYIIFNDKRNYRPKVVEQLSLEERIKKREAEIMNN